MQDKSSKNRPNCKDKVAWQCSSYQVPLVFFSDVWSFKTKQIKNKNKNKTNKIDKQDKVFSNGVRYDTVWLLSDSECPLSAL